MSWVHPNQDWITWVSRMQSKHQAAWKKSGGYSVLGSPVSCFVENREWEVIEEKMMDARMNIVFPIAICLARGIPIALAPAVLASIYRDLSRLKRAIVAGNNESRLELFSPVQLVQFWAWERFPILQPKPDVLNFGDPRSARWDRAKIPKIPKVENVRLTLDSAAESFLWRPYAKSLKNWSFPEFYRENEELVLADSGFDI
uniref:Aminotransferase-like plant mobile domain-containing protein n=1 Tax=Salix viminalis TaxID=40686 RepID=A0A6N2K8X8_SALVM